MFDQTRARKNTYALSFFRLNANHGCTRGEMLKYADVFLAIVRD